MNKEEFFKLYDEAHKNKPVNPDIIDPGMDKDVEKVIFADNYVEGDSNE